MKTYILPILVSTTILMSACTSTPIEDNAPLPQITFDHLTQIPVNVSDIEFTVETMRGAKVWHLSDDLPTPPDVAMRRYLNKRFKATGRNGILDISLTKAEIQVNESPNENKILSYIALSNNEDYTFEIIVDLNSTYQSGQPDTKTSTRFVRKVRMPLNVTIAYREAKLQKTLEEMMRDIDESLIITLSDQFNLIADKDVPERNLTVKTETPEKETKIGVMWKNFKQDVKDANDNLKKKMNKNNTEKAEETKIEVETSATPQPLINSPVKDVEIESLNKY